MPRNALKLLVKKPLPPPGGAVMDYGLAAALFATSGVFSIVMFAWSGLAAMMGPVLVIRLARMPLPSWLGVAMVLTGLGVVVGWTYTPLSASIMKILPGMLAPILLYVIVYQVSLKKAANHG